MIRPYNQESWTLPRISSTLLCLGCLTSEKRKMTKQRRDGKSAKSLKKNTKLFPKSCRLLTRELKDRKAPLGLTAKPTLKRGEGSSRANCCQEAAFRKCRPRDLAQLKAIALTIKPIK
jgi:predicted transposase YbfD/YdcC